MTLPLLGLEINPKLMIISITFPFISFSSKPDPDCISSPPPHRRRFAGADSRGASRNAGRFRIPGV